MLAIFKQKVKNVSLGNNERYPAVLFLRYLYKDLLVYLFTFIA